MKRILYYPAALAICLMAACSNNSEGSVQSAQSIQTEAPTQSAVSDPTAAISEILSETPAEFTSEQTDTKEKETLNIEITIGNQTFSAELYDNEAARALMGHLPMTLNMSELNGNEKYYYLENDLPADPSIPSSGICNGDIMLYGSNCLVLFYDSFSTPYSYTPLGRIDDPNGLASALGGGSVQVTFKAG